MAAHSYRIPTTSSRVAVDLLHPVLAHRVAAVCDRLVGLRVVSGTRTEAQQRWLFDAYVSGRRKILAADPDRVWSTKEGRGSRHMVQSDGYGHAVDFRLGRGQSWAQVHQVAKSCGLGFPVRTENWHATAAVPGHLHKWRPAPALEGLPEPSEPPKLSIIGKLIEDSRKLVLRRGSRGAAVRFVQAVLTSLGWLPPGQTDGIYGRRTEQAMRRAQAAAGLAADGICGQRSWAMLIDTRPQAPASGRRTG